MNNLTKVLMTDEEVLELLKFQMYCGVTYLLDEIIKFKYNCKIYKIVDKKGRMVDYDVLEDK